MFHVQQLHRNYKTHNLQSQGNCTTDTHELRTEENRLEMNVQQSHNTDRKEEKKHKACTKAGTSKNKKPEKTTFIQ